MENEDDFLQSLGFTPEETTEPEKDEEEAFLEKLGFTQESQTQAEVTPEEEVSGKLSAKDFDHSKLYAGMSYDEAVAKYNELIKRDDVQPLSLIHI